MLEDSSARQSLSNKEKRDLDCEISFLEGLTKRDPQYVEALQLLGDNYTKRNRYQDGLTVDEHLADLLPERLPEERHGPAVPQHFAHVHHKPLSCLDDGSLLPSVLNHVDDEGEDVDLLVGIGDDRCFCWYRCFYFVLLLFIGIRCNI